jgi:hypothetical protein
MPDQSRWSKKHLTDTSLAARGMLAWRNTWRPTAPAEVGHLTFSAEGGYPSLIIEVTVKVNCSRARDGVDV